MPRLLPRLLGPTLWILIAWLGPADLSPAARHALGMAAWMVTWWMTEAAPLAATSLLPIALFPVLGITGTREAAAPYASDLVFLFMGGFFLAAGLEHWHVHTRIAYGMVLKIGLSGRRVVLGVMLATGFISMWISNTATAAMMYPIAMAIGAMFGLGDSADRTRTALMLGVAYAASIGGMATLIGSPPNLVTAGAIEQFTGRSIGFGEFMLLGLPMVAILLPACWALLVFGVFRTRLVLGPEATTAIVERQRALGPLRGGEARVLVIFVATALAWLLRDTKDLGSVTIPGLVELLPGLSDASIAIICTVLLFVIPGRTGEGTTRPLLTWAEGRRIPWDVLLLFGGGLSMAGALDGTGVTEWLGSQLAGLGGAPSVVVYLGIAVTVLLLSELASNLAVAAMTMPIMVSLSQVTGEPVILLMLVAGFAASTGFALPIATPPNAIVFGSGQVSVRDMAKGGLLLDLVAVVVVTGVMLLLGRGVLGL